MTDLSSTLDQLLQKHNSRLQHHRRSISDITDEFLKQAYRIQSNIAQLHTYLLSIRSPYLSTSAPARTKRSSAPSTTHLTPTQRDAIDSTSKSTIRDLNRRLAELASTEAQRKEIREALRRKRAEKRLGGRLGAALGRWAGGEEGASAGVVLTPEEEEEESRESTRDEWRESVIWYLRARLGAAVECQRDMMERRVQREVERSKSVLYKTAGEKVVVGGVEGEAARTAMVEEMGGEGEATEGGFTPAQLQEFAEENSAMLRHYENSLDQVRAAERSMVEIAELQTTLIQNLEIQTERIDQLAEDSVRTGENVSGGNKQLKKAAERWRPAKMMFWISCGLSGFLIAWDLLI